MNVSVTICVDYFVIKLCNKYYPLKVNLASPGFHQGGESLVSMFKETWFPVWSCGNSVVPGWTTFWADASVEAV